MENIETPNIKPKAIIYGLIIGVISVVLSIISLYITKTGTGLITSAVIAGLVNYGLFLVIVVLFIISLRKAIGGYWSLAVALKHIYIMLAVNVIIGTIGMLAFNMAKPDVQMEALDNTKNLTIELLESQGASDEQIDERVAMIEEQQEGLMNMTIGQNIKGLMVMLVIYFVLALIFAAIFKKEPPMFIKAPTPDSAHPWQDSDQEPTKES